MSALGSKELSILKLDYNQLTNEGLEDHAFGRLVQLQSVYLDYNLITGMIDYQT